VARRLHGRSGGWTAARKCATIRRVRYTVEHFRAVEADERPLGVAYVPTGKVDQVEAHDPPAAAAIALSEGEDLMDVDVVSYDPGDDLYGVVGEDEAVRVKAS
jgi:hypothetical protein